MYNTLECSILLAIKRNFEYLVVETVAPGSEYICRKMGWQEVSAR
jgi:hypothetical protein